MIIFAIRRKNYDFVSKNRKRKHTKKGSFFEITVFKNKTGKSVAGMQQYRIAKLSLY